MDVYNRHNLLLYAPTHPPSIDTALNSTTTADLAIDTECLPGRYFCIASALPIPAQPNVRLGSNHEVGRRRHDSCCGCCGHIDAGGQARCH